MAALKIVLLLDAEALRLSSSKPQRPAWSEPNLMEAAVFDTLSSRGYTVSVTAVTGPIRKLAAQLSKQAPDLVFNFALHHRGDRRKAAQIAGLFDLLRIPYTGAGAQGILRACDKALSKHLVRLIGVRTPGMISVPPGAQPRDHQLVFPVIVKPRFEGGSEGITADSVTRTQAALRARVAWVHRRYGQDAVCEEFIAGKDVSIGLIGNARVHVFPFRERILPAVADAVPQFADFRMKQSQSKTGMTAHWKRLKISSRQRHRMEEEAKRIYVELQLRDYAQLDYRLAPSGAFYFLEANHCPDCAPHSFGVFAAWRAIEFADLLDLIMAKCLERCRRSPTGLTRATAAQLRQLTTGLGNARAQIE